MKATMSADKARKKIRGEDVTGKKSGTSKEKSTAKKSMKQKTSCMCGM